MTIHIISKNENNIILQFKKVKRKKNNYDNNKCFI